MDLNKVMLIGRLTRDPELRTTTTGKSVASMAIATGRAWTDQAGAKQEKTEFTNCVLWGKLADIAGQYLAKGRQVYVEGRLETRDWVGTDGVKRYRTEVIVENMIMLGSGGQRGAGPAGAANIPASAQSSGAMMNDSSAPVEEEIKVEDIPF
jgi:single-strand DNA-binding protein